MSAPYVALGDSFSAGIGSDTPGTQVRRQGGFPILLAHTLGLDLDYQAVNGATVEDVLRVQVPALGPQTRLVTVTVGGNDAEFVPVLTACLQPAWLSDGLLRLRLAMAHTAQNLPGRLDRLYAAIRTAAPQAHVVAAGYPRLFAGVDCQLLTFFSAAEMTALNRAADDLAALQRAAAERNGADFVDVRAAYATHALCLPDPWLHGLSWPLDDSFHPTAAGHTAYAGAVEPAVRAALSTGGRERAASVAEPRRAPRVQEGPARRGSGDRFRLRDLLTPQNLDTRVRRRARRP